MILVDSSVWIDYLSHRTSLVEKVFEGMIRPVNQVVSAGIIQQEVLQGIDEPRSYELTKKMLKRFPVLDPDLACHHAAADFYRRLKSQGRRPASIDALLSALAIRFRAAFYTLDRGFHDYVPMGLKLYHRP